MEGYVDHTNKKRERRYEPPTNEIARQRLDTFRESVKQFQKERPEILGATLYGSMMKGSQAREESDIDAFMYIDGELLKDKNVDTEKYRTTFLENFGGKDSGEREYFEDLRLKELSSEIIDKEIEDQISHYKEYKNYKNTLDEKYAEATTEKDKETLLKQEPFRNFDFAISGMFHPRIGTGIEKYRKVFLEKMRSISDREIAEKIWGEVAFNLRTYETRKDPTVEIVIPETLEDAMRLYDPGSAIQLRKESEENKIKVLKASLL